MVNAVCVVFYYRDLLVCLDLKEHVVLRELP